MLTWDYKIKKGWKPKTPADWKWYLERRINYDDWKGIEMAQVEKHLRALRIHPAKKLLIAAYLKHYGRKRI